ncbi:capsular polysaccharide biosynthesis protein [Paenibacillus sp. V4I3]|uniref:YveK family protein n=1 Tax=Paenibacillus sp. V4I3 TaxID=3042305 RepID=UPI002787E77E|nr:Wzz/FepE/Etk N-terminal domain-containing protein [Paenibacillus sp. V4I3]MDQ0873196.1 capsular polysaccharide biosynthesis protein [Paenibacillus sp. V4I3]
MEAKQYISVIKRRLWVIILFVLISCLTTAFISKYVIKPVYQASAELIVNKASQYAGSEQLNFDSIRTNIQLIETYKQILKSRAVMDEVIKKHPNLNLTVKELNEEVNVSSIKETQVMTISMRDKDYEHAAAVVNAVADMFRSKILTIMNVDNVTILNEAQEQFVDPIPVSPNLKRNLLGSLMISLLIAVGMVIMIEFLDDTIKSEEDITSYLGIVTLGSVSEVKRRDMNKQGTPASKQVKGGEASYAAAKS